MTNNNSNRRDEQQAEAPPAKVADVLWATPIYSGLLWEIHYLAVDQEGDPDSHWVYFDPAKEDLDTELERTPHFWSDEAKAHLRSLIPGQLSRPSIVSGGRQLRDMTTDAVSALVDANEPPTLFVQSGSVVRVRKDERGRPIIDQMSKVQMKNRLTEVADWVGAQQIPVPPNDTVVQDVLALGNWNFPPLEAIVEAPVIRADGTHLSRPGYDPATRLYYSPTDQLEIKTPARPDADDVAKAVGVLDEAIGDMPFVDDASRANAFALLLTPLVRPLIEGPIPLALIDAPKAGTGKSLLAKVVSRIATGRQPSFYSAPGDNDETRKQITSILMRGTTIIVFDNVSVTLKNDSLAKALTDDVWGDRQLGHSRALELPVRATWMATGNNIKVGGDIPRRCYVIRLDAKQAQPWERTGFRHEHLEQWVGDNRELLLGAAFTLCKAWLHAGRPNGEAPVMGSYESWTSTLGGILAFAGIDGFLENRDEFYAGSDTDTIEWQSFMQAWHGAFESRWMTAKDIAANLAEKQLIDVLPEDLAAAYEDHQTSFTRRLGKALAIRQDNVWPNGLKLEKGDSYQNAATWRVTAP